MLVIKIGGSKGTSYETLVNDISQQDEKIVLVHGGSHELNELQEKLGNSVETIKSPSGFVSRRSTRKTMEMFCMIYCGKMNKMFVEMLQKKGINAVGLSGLDGRLLEGKRRVAIRSMKNDKIKIIRDDLSGKIEKINLPLINLLLQNNYFPVITPPGISYESDIMNTDGDRVASMIAIGLKADTLIILSDVPGLLKDINDPNSLIEKISKDDIDSHMVFAKGRMKKKVLGAKEAIDGGVKRVIFASANVENPISSALKNKGTVIE